MKKGWTIVTDIEQLAKLAQDKCDGTHEHDESRGKALKEAEGYIFELADLAHKCFSETI